MQLYSMIKSNPYRSFAMGICFFAAGSMVVGCKPMIQASRSAYIVGPSNDIVMYKNTEVDETAKNAAARADVVITMLPAGEHVRQVWLHQGGLIDVVKDAKPLLIDCSTIDVDSARTVTAAAAEAGMAMLDALPDTDTVRE